MLKRYSPNFALLSITLDGLLVLSALYLSLHINLIHGGSSRIVTDLGIYISMPFAWILVNLYLQLYDNKNNFFFSQEVLLLFVSSLAAGLVLAGLAYLFNKDMPRMSFLAFMSSGTILELLWRIVVRVYWRRLFFREESSQHVLILGAGETGQKIAGDLSRPKWMKPPVIFFLDDDIEQRAVPGVLGPLSALSEILTNFRIDDIIIALPQQAFDKVTEAVLSIRKVPVNVWLVPASHRLALYRASIADFAGLPMLDLRAPAISPNDRLVKRAFDLVFSSIMLLLAALPMLVICLLIKLDSPGPVIFRQKRIGENEKEFEILKFRTMVPDAETRLQTITKKDGNGNLLHKVPNDPRVTRLGRFLRKTSLDELPQFINVLRGEMSVVGPRPELPFLVEKYDDWQYIRFSVQPGITGWWQVTGRSDAPMHMHTEKDIFYIRNYSFWLDLQIIARTVWIVIFGKGAF
ncbi:MAG: sugar transferase [Chloroflexota bacterium]